MLFTLNLLLLGSTVSAMWGSWLGGSGPTRSDSYEPTSQVSSDVDLNSSLEFRREFQHSNVLSFPANYISTLLHMEPGEISKQDQPFYKYYEAWKQGWKVDFNLSKSVIQFNRMTDMVRRGQSIGFDSPIYEGQEDHLAKIPVDLVFEWIDTLTDLNLRQRTLVLKHESDLNRLAIENVQLKDSLADLEKRNVAQLKESAELFAGESRRASDFEQAVTELHQKLSALESDLENGKLELFRAREANCELERVNSNFKREVSNVAVKLEHAQETIEIAKKEAGEEAQRQSLVIEELKSAAVQESATSQNAVEESKVRLEQCNFELEASKAKNTRLSEKLERCKRTVRYYSGAVERLQEAVSRIREHFGIDNWMMYRFTGDYSYVLRDMGIRE